MVYQNLACSSIIPNTLAISKLKRSLNYQQLEG